jgi:hypothetical protein
MDMCAVGRLFQGKALNRVPMTFQTAGPNTTMPSTRV